MTSRSHTATFVQSPVSVGRSWASVASVLPVMCDVIGVNVMVKPGSTGTPPPVVVLHTENAEPGELPGFLIGKNHFG